MSGPLLGSYIALWILVAVLSVAVFALYHHFGQMYLNSREGRETQGPDLGATPPESMGLTSSAGASPFPGAWRSYSSSWKRAAGYARTFNPR